MDSSKSLLELPSKKTGVPACTLCCQEKEVSVMDAALRLYHCAFCDHAFTVKSKQELEVYEEKYYLEKHTNWFANPNYPYFKRIHRGILKFKKDARNLLDVGYGNGDFLKYLAEQNERSPAGGRGPALSGIDSLKIEHAKVRFIQGDFFSYLFRERFDVITSFMVIEHVEDPRGFVKKLFDCLEPGGILFISTNNNGGMLYTLARFLKRAGLRTAYDRVYSDHHLQHFTNRSLRLLIEKSGFKIEGFQNHNYLLKAVDTPPAHFFVKKLYLLAVCAIFALSDLRGNGFLQTFICRKPVA